MSHSTTTQASQSIATAITSPKLDNTQMGSPAKRDEKENFCPTTGLFEPKEVRRRTKRTKEREVLRELNEEEVQARDGILDARRRRISGGEDHFEVQTVPVEVEVEAEASESTTSAAHIEPEVASTITTRSRRQIPAHVSNPIQVLRQSDASPGLSRAIEKQVKNYRRLRDLTKTSPIATRPALAPKPLASKRSRQADSNLRSPPIAIYVDSKSKPVPTQPDMEEDAPRPRKRRSISATRGGFYDENASIPKTKTKTTFAVTTKTTSAVTTAPLQAKLQPRAEKKKTTAKSGGLNTLKRLTAFDSGLPQIKPLGHASRAKRTVDVSSRLANAQKIR